MIDYGLVYEEQKHGRHPKCGILYAKPLAASWKNVPTALFKINLCDFFDLISWLICL